jgi:MerR family transcriptional regulator, light-induced transcriptional regulator
MNLQTAAERLGVHYQTIYRWVREGDLTAVKRGSSYDVAEDEVVRFLALRQVPGAPPSQLVVRSWQPHCDRLLEMLLSGDELEARGIADRLIDGHVSTIDICERLIAPCLREVGERWHRGEVSIAEEHRATAICVRILARAAAHPRGRPRGTAVVLAAPGDEHSIPSSMAALVLRDDRWRVHHLGGNVPANDLIALAHSAEADLIVLSRTYGDLKDVEDLRSLLEAEHFKVLVGGADGTTLGDLVAAARTMTKAQNAQNVSSTNVADGAHVADGSENIN